MGRHQSQSLAIVLHPTLATPEPRGGEEGGEDGGGGANGGSNASSARQHPAVLLYPGQNADLVHCILSFATGPVLTRAAQVNRAWQAASIDDEFWASACRERFGVLPQQLSPPPPSSLGLYKRMSRSLSTVQDEADLARVSQMGVPPAIAESLFSRFGRVRSASF